MSKTFSLKLTVISVRNIFGVTGFKTLKLQMVSLRPVEPDKLMFGTHLRQDFYLCNVKEKSLKRCIL